MKLISVVITDVMFRRPGLNKICFIADYGVVRRRGTVVYDIINGKFLTHTSDIELLAALCISISKHTTLAR